jgi:hypothetical protein
VLLSATNRKGFLHILAMFLFFGGSGCIHSRNTNEQICFNDDSRHFLQCEFKPFCNDTERSVQALLMRPCGVWSIYQKHEQNNRPKI